MPQAKPNVLSLAIFVSTLLQQISAQAICGGGNGTRVAGNTDTCRFNVFCGRDSDGDNFIGIANNIADDTACVNACDANPSCIVGIYDGTGDCVLGGANTDPATYTYPSN